MAGHDKKNERGGIDHIVEVGKDTLPQSVEATKVGGIILVIGVLSGFTQEIGIPSMFSKNLHVAIAFPHS
jgi:threonine dehydrogenase-like Zn-dependent dehydrogenase